MNADVKSPVPYNNPMIIYSDTKRNFLDDSLDCVLEDKLKEKLRSTFGHCPSQAEVNSWTNSLKQMSLILSNTRLPDNVGIAVEYNIPYTSKRVDLIITGYDASKQPIAIIIELKQWSEVKSVRDKDGIVRTFLGGKERETTHPSFQVYSYKMFISDFNAEVQDRNIRLEPMAYLHNYVLDDTNDPLVDPIYDEYIEQAPIFTKMDARKLIEHLNRSIEEGDDQELAYCIDSGKLRPSKSLQDMISSMLKGNSEFTLLDEQKIVFELIKSNAAYVSKAEDRKKVIIVEGGPGTGKSVVAVNLLSELTNMSLATAYVSKNSAPREVYSTKLKGDMKGTRIKSMFLGSGSFTNAKENMYDVLLVDEAHRLNEKSGMYHNLGENQIKEIIRASRLAVFFIDESQRVTLNDIGTIDAIKEQCDLAGVRCEWTELTSQFRCNGSDGYISWLDNTLHIRRTANRDLTGIPYDFRVFDDPKEMHDAIVRLNEVNNKSRLVAGYCWNWISDSKNDTDVHDIVIPEHDFRISWNLGNTKTWAIDDSSVNEAGCIHTCQGLEFDYVGVIIGDDISYRDGRIVTDHSKRARTDQSLNGLKSRYGDEGERYRIADAIIKNTYRTLMSRGMKGCFVYCTDSGMQEYLKRMSVRIQY